MNNFLRRIRPVILSSDRTLAIPWGRNGFITLQHAPEFRRRRPSMMQWIYSVFRR